MGENPNSSGAGPDHLTESNLDLIEKVKPQETADEVPQERLIKIEGEIEPC